MKIYFAYSISDLHSEYERECIERIKEEFGWDIEIINVKAMLSRVDKLELEKRDGKGFKEIVKKFEYFIDICDVMVCAKTWNNIAFRERYSNEVVEEIEYAKKVGKRLLEFGC